MPMLSRRSEGILKTARSFTELLERVDDDGIIGVESDGVFDSCAKAIEAGAGELEFDVVAGGHLGGVRFHGGGPYVEDFGRGYVDEDGDFVAWFGSGCDGVEKQVVDCV